MRRPDPMAWGILAAGLLACLVGMAMPTAIAAQNTPAAAIPNGMTGYFIDFSVTDETHAYSNFCIRVTRQPAKPIAEIERFTVTVTAAVSWYADLGHEVVGRLEIPAGKTVGEICLPVSNRLLSGYGSQVRVLVEPGRGNGRIDGSDLLHGYFDLNNAVVSGTGVHWARLAPIESSASELRYPYWPGIRENQRGTTLRWSPGSTVSMGSTAPSFNAGSAANGDTAFESRLPPVSLDTLDNSWLSLMASKALVISLPNFEAVCRDTPQRREVLQDWVAAGGALVVYDPRGGLDHAASIVPQLAGLSESEVPGIHGYAYSMADRQPTPCLSTRAEQWPENTEFFAIDCVAGLVVATGDLESPGQLPLLARVQSIVDMAVGLVDTGFADPELDFRWDGNGFGRRVGFQSPLIQRSSVPRSPIEGVGEPPLLLFALLIGGFLLLVGPVLIGLVRYRLRTPQLYFAVPVVSLVLCLMILGYAAVSDFSTRLGRAHTVTQIHVPTGMALARTTAAYYCGSLPEAYEFPAAVDVVSDVSGDEVLGYEYTDDRLKFSGTRIRPRTVHKVVAQRPAKTDQTIVVRAGDSDASPIVTNQLGGTIESLVVRLGEDYYRAGNLGAGESVPLERIATPAMLGEALFGSLDEAERQYLPNRGLEFYGASPVFTYRSMMEWTLPRALPRNGDFMASMESEPLSDELLRPVDYQQKLQLIHGQH